MTGPQFAHFETYALSASKLKGARRADAGEKRQRGTGGWSARQILAEAMREDGAHPHVATPIPPDAIIGDLADLAQQLEELERDPPKGQRRDTPILLAGVLSAPWAPGDPRTSEWAMDAANWLKQEWGANLRCVVGHTDESHDHLHFYVTAPGWSNVKHLHPGAVARRKAADEGEAPKAQKAAFSDAMRAFQDRYWAAVGAPHGMTRIGPKRRRLTRAEWLQEKQQAAALAEATRQAKAVIDRAQETADQMMQRMRSTVEQKMHQLSKREHELNAQARDLEAQARAVEAERQRVAEEKARTIQMLEAMTPDEQYRAATKLEKLKQQASREDPETRRSTATPRAPRLRS